MEILNSFYQQRIQSITRSFLFLLQQLEKTITPFSDIQLSSHKIEYLQHIITTTLNQDREKFIQQLYQQIQALQSQLQQPNSTFYEHCALANKQYSKNSTCSRTSSLENEGNKARQARKGHHNTYTLTSYKQNSENIDLEFNSQSSISSWNSKKSTKNENIGFSQSTIKLDRHANTHSDYQKEDSLFEFKYLKINKY